MGFGDGMFSSRFGRIDQRGSFDRRFNRTRTLTNVGAVAVLVIVIVGVLFGSCIASVGGTDGHHSGYVTAVEKADNWVSAFFTFVNGVDATIVYVKSNPAATQEDKYCVNDPEVKAKLEQAAVDGTRVTVHYHNDFLMMKWECNGGSTIIVGVEPSPAEARGH